jgi:hypothetical protein
MNVRIKQQDRNTKAITDVRWIEIKIGDQEYHLSVSAQNDGGLEIMKVEGTRLTVSPASGNVIILDVYDRPRPVPADAY